VSQVAESGSKQQYEFVEYANEQRFRNPNTGKLVRTHVMQNFQRQKRRLQNKGIESQRNDVEAVVSTERRLVVPPERWSKDPFNCFPIKMEPYMHELLYLCKLRKLSY
jgi:hypothetical protein